jgi:hypothetical protein
MTNWQNGQVFTAGAYVSERNTIIAAVNGTDAELQTVEDTADAAILLAKETAKYPLFENTLSTIAGVPNIPIYADAVKPLADPAGRDGWYFKNDWYSGVTTGLTNMSTGYKKINWYFYNPEIYTHEYTGLRYAYAVVTMDKTEKPFFYVYTSANGTTVSSTYIFSTTTDAVVAGGTYLFWFGAIDPDGIHPELPRVEMTLTSGVGTQSPTEEILAIAFTTSSGATQDAVEFLTSELGFRADQDYQNYSLEIASNKSLVTNLEVYQIMGVY